MFLSSNMASFSDTQFSLLPPLDTASHCKTEHSRPHSFFCSSSQFTRTCIWDFAPPSCYFLVEKSFISTSRFALTSTSLPKRQPVSMMAACQGSMESGVRESVVGGGEMGMGISSWGMEGPNLMAMLEADLVGIGSWMTEDDERAVEQHVYFDSVGEKVVVPLQKEQKKKADMEMDDLFDGEEQFEDEDVVMEEKGGVQEQLAGELQHGVEQQLGVELLHGVGQQFVGEQQLGGEKQAGGEQQFVGGQVLGVAEQFWGLRDQICFGANQYATTGINGSKEQPEQGAEAGQEFAPAGAALGQVLDPALGYESYDNFGNAVIGTTVQGYHPVVPPSTFVSKTALGPAPGYVASQTWPLPSPSSPAAAPVAAPRQAPDVKKSAGKRLVVEGDGSITVAERRQARMSKRGSEPMLGASPDEVRKTTNLRRKNVVANEKEVEELAWQEVVEDAKKVLSAEQLEGVRKSLVQYVPRVQPEAEKEKAEADAEQRLRNEEWEEEATRMTEEEKKERKKARKEELKRWKNTLAKRKSEDKKRGTRFEVFQRATLFAAVAGWDIPVCKDKSRETQLTDDWKRADAAAKWQ